MKNIQRAVLIGLLILPSAPLYAEGPPLLTESVHRIGGPFGAYIEDASIKTGLHPRLIEAVIHVETGGNPDPARAVSYEGAIGPMQLEPATARWLHVNPWSPRENILGAARYIKYLVKRFGTVRRALMAYNQGPSAVVEGRVCPAAIRYSDDVLAYERRLR
jgi:soluble lytic murein transglycosylase-like protein